MTDPAPKNQKFSTGSLPLVSIITDEAEVPIGGLCEAKIDVKSSTNVNYKEAKATTRALSVLVVRGMVIDGDAGQKAIIAACNNSTPLRLAIRIGPSATSLTDCLLLSNRIAPLSEFDWHCERWVAESDKSSVSIYEFYLKGFCEG